MMFDVSKVSWEKVKNPNDLFSWFVPDPKDPIDFEKKMVRFKNYLMDKYLYLSDEFRNPRYIDAIVYNYFFGQQFNIFYEMGDFQGLVGFMNIIPGFKSGLIFKIWDKDAWTNGNARKMRECAKIVMDELGLERLTIQTPDRRMLKFGKIIGFNHEGTLPKNFLWNKKLYTTYLLGFVKEDEHDESNKKQTIVEKTKKTAKKKDTKTSKNKTKNTKKEIKGEKNGE